MCLLLVVSSPSSEYLRLFLFSKSRANPVAQCLARQGRGGREIEDLQTIKLFFGEVGGGGIFFLWVFQKI